VGSIWKPRLLGLKIEGAAGKKWPANNYIEKIMAALFLAALFIQVEENAGSACSRSRLIDQDVVSYSCS
jgi:hypothetical protein